MGKFIVPINDLAIYLEQQFCLKAIVAKSVSFLSDLYFTCQENTTKPVRAPKLPKHEKADSVKVQQPPLDRTQTRECFTEKPVQK